MDTFKGKKGKPLSGIEYLVRHLNTWSTKTLLLHIRQFDLEPESLTHRQTLIVQLASAMIKADKAQHPL